MVLQNHNLTSEIRVNIIEEFNFVEKCLNLLRDNPEKWEFNIEKKFGGDPVVFI